VSANPKHPTPNRAKRAPLIAHAGRYLILQELTAVEAPGEHKRALPADHGVFLVARDMRPDPRVPG
jgi:hypothetical protein